MGLLAQTRFRLALIFLAGFLLPPSLAAQEQDDPNDAPLGDVARTLRKQTPGSTDVIDNDNLAGVMARAESHRPTDSALKFLMDGEEKGFHVSAPDVTCSLSFSANTKALLANQYAQMDLPAAEVLKLAGPATIEGDALQVSIFNGTGWHVSEVAVALTLVKNLDSPEAAQFIDPMAGSEVRPEKKPDVTMLYRMRAGAAPMSTTVFSAPLNIELAPGQEWHWAIVQAKGYPPRTAIATMQQTSNISGPDRGASPPIPPSGVAQNSQNLSAPVQDLSSH
jgi:hypothetical protein